jgi:predicted nucleotidyltransferase/DNA-binding XRE family transcriptional regulator
MDVAAILREARKAAGLTQAELGRAAGTSQPALARYETGAALPSLPTLVRLLDACGRGLEVTTVNRDAPDRGGSVRALLGPQAVRLRQRRHRLLEAARRHGVHHVRVFGSLARGTATPSSDIDLLVDLLPGRTLLDLVAFQEEAAEILDMPTDVAVADILKARVAASALRDAIPL